MKKLFFLLAVAAANTASAQTSSAPEGFSSGYLINNNNEKSEGLIKESFKKGSITFSANGSKKNYTPADINEFAVGTNVYVAYMNDFYKVSAAGNKGSLLQKVTNNSGKLIYNGTEGYAANTTEGKPGDYYLRIKASDKFALVTKQNFEKVFASFCSDCTALLTNIQSKQLDYNTIEKAVEQYNNCN